MERDRLMTDIQIDSEFGTVSEILLAYPVEDFMDVMTDKGYHHWTSVCGPYINICTEWQTVDGSYRQFTLPLYERHGDVYFSHNEARLLEVISQLISDNAELIRKVDMYKSIFRDVLKPHDGGDDDAETD